MRFAFLLLILGITFQSCKDDKVDNTQPEQVQIDIRILHKIGGQEVSFDTIKYMNAYGNEYSVATLKYFVSDFVFQKADGNEYILDAEFYVDGVEGALSSTFMASTEIPAGEYSSVSFIFGIDSIKNKTGRFPDPPENQMEWPPPMGGGYHYMKLEGKFDQNDTIKNYQCHTGPTMGNANYIHISLQGSSFTASGSMKTLTINMDINKWFEGPNTLDLNDITGIMGNQAMQLLLKENGSDVFTLESIE